MLAELLSRNDIEVSELTPRQAEVLNQFLELCGEGARQFECNWGDHNACGDMDVCMFQGRRGWFRLSVHRTGLYDLKFRFQEDSVYGSSLPLPEFAQMVRAWQEVLGGSASQDFG